jgi:hypothetical protein
VITANRVIKNSATGSESIKKVAPYQVLPWRASGVKGDSGHRYLMGMGRYPFPYTASTCDVMYRRQRRHLYNGGENLK